MATKKIIDNLSKQYLIGIDEVGRGPLAGPVTVGIVAIDKKSSSKTLKDLKKLGLNDSKKLKESDREKISAVAKKLNIRYATVSMGASFIDSRGISKAVRVAIARGLKRLNLDPKNCDVKLDGLLHAPEIYIKQETIIKGDEKEPIISLASVIAKVTRDRKMVRLAKKIPKYGFEVHKGYGTKRHMEAVLKYGLSEEHRRSFCSNFLK